MTCPCSLLHSDVCPASSASPCYRSTALYTRPRRRLPSLRFVSLRLALLQPTHTPRANVGPRPPLARQRGCSQHFEQRCQQRCSRSVRLGERRDAGGTAAAGAGWRGRVSNRCQGQRGRGSARRGECHHPRGQWDRTDAAVSCILCLALMRDGPCVAGGRAGIVADRGTVASCRTW